MLKKKYLQVVILGARIDFIFCRECESIFY